MRLTHALGLILPALSGTAAAAAGASSCDNAAGNNLTVSTEQGEIRGIIDPSTPAVRRFLGIPYAKPPLGDLRFSPPQKAGPFSGGVFQANNLGPSCEQFLMKTPPSIYTQVVNEFNLQGLNETSPNVSEDCLTLSVWAPAAPTECPSGGLPVIVFIYGGAFAMGGQDVPYQIPARWIERAQDLIVVTFNYRVNIFGFPNAAGLVSDAQNLGLLDQRLAVEWVHDNIASFGGDPDRVTLWGQSAGAISAGYYQYAYPNDALIDAVIMDSGAETLKAAAGSTADTNHSAFSYVAGHVGCGGLGAAEELACMRSVSAAAIEDAIEAREEATGLPFFFTPVVDNVTVFADYANRPVANVPTIIGTNVNDGVAFVPIGINGVNETLAQVATLAVFFCPGTQAAEDRVAAGVPVYRFLYAGIFPNISPAPFLGAYHQAELPLLFGTAGEFRGPSTALENATSVAMQDAWYALASAGVEGMAEVGWPRYTGPGGLVREFASPDGTVQRDVSLLPTEALCTF
ncbi:acetylcholinesterase [Echria macrotheca]|uniref:Carboxylic ester hydrolase n=1 Tax=Echria macrotheca TaxID=438768 RepID=A0AAJ0B601_9PEZI|nr:acetylcholinesterase [Echria macrotheca]